MKWMPVVGYEGRYEVSVAGDVRSVERTKVCGRGGTQRVPMRILRLHSNRGYLMVHLCADGSKKMHYVHRLVAAAFLGLAESEQVNHRNGIKSDNRAANLEPATSLQNVRHSIATGLRDTVGARNPNATLTANDVREIRQALKTGSTQISQALKFGVQHGCISKIASGRTWRSVA